MPPLKIKKENEGIFIESINPRFISVKNTPVPIEESSPFGIREIQKEKRTNLLHYVIHLLAFIIIIPFIFFIAWGVDIPKEYYTIVSIVIGFYFGKALVNV